MPSLDLNSNGSVWSRIVNVCVLVGNGHNSSFWSDVCLGDNCLVVQFSRIFSLPED